MKLNDQQIDALAELMNIGAGRAAASLSELLHERILLSVTKVTEYSAEQLRREIDLDQESIDATVIQGFHGKLSGQAMLAFRRSSAIALGRILARIEVVSPEIEEDLAGMLEEVGNIALNGVMGSISNFVRGELRYTVPTFATAALVRRTLWTDLEDHPSNKRVLIVASSRLAVQGQDIDGAIMLLFDIQGLDEFFGQLLTVCENQ